MKIFGQLLIIVALISGCSDDKPWNNPYSSEQSKLNIYYSSFSERPKHLDPALSYSSNEWIITNQIYEPLLQYHYLKRPYTLEPLTASAMPIIKAYNQVGKEVPLDSPTIAKTVYQINIKKGIFYADHPAFAKNDEGEFLYHNLARGPYASVDFYTIADFDKVGTRELVAEDFVYQIKRLAHHKLNSPIYAHMSVYISGLKKFRETLEELEKKQGIEAAQVYFRNGQIDGVRAVGPHLLEIDIKGHYPQFQFWLAMPFFAPMPFEADLFYNQEILKDHNVSLDWYPVGTGPFVLSDNNPSLQMVLSKNPTFHGESFPNLDSKGINLEPALLAQFKSLEGQPLPFLDKIIFTLEKESIPYWNKFSQGYYDASGVSSDNFDSAFNMQNGQLSLSDNLSDKNVRMVKSPSPSIHYYGVNMKDEVLGGYSEKVKALRLAISLAFDTQEYINIFLNGRGQVANSILPPEIFGHQSTSKHSLKSESQKLQLAKEALKMAGYPDGIDNGQPLNLFLDTPMESGPDAKEQFNWLRKQFQKLGINLIIRATQYNRFQDKMKNATAQIFAWGWNADYPDPENFMFLLYGPNSKALYDGENASNFQNAQYDKLFEQMKLMPNGPERLKIIEQMNAIIDENRPWISGFYPESFTLLHSWVGPTLTNAMSRNTLKYIKINPELRAQLQKEWNQPILWPLAFVIVLILILFIPAYLTYQKLISQKITARVN